MLKELRTATEKSAAVKFVAGLESDKTKTIQRIETTYKINSTEGKQNHPPQASRSG